MLNSGFGQLATTDINLYPESHQQEIDLMNDRLYDGFNNGVYRAGFASSQKAYEKAVEKIFGSINFLERHLTNCSFLVAEQLTEADIRAFVTMVRFDVAYYSLFKTNLAQLRDYPNISDYMRRIYNLPGIAETVNFDHIRKGYYSIKALNPLGIVPKGLDLNARL